MYVPEPKQNKDGQWKIQLRINGQSIVVKASTAKECKRRAAIIKAEAQESIRAAKSSELTLTQAIDNYIDARQNSLSPSTIRGYRIIQRTRFQSSMQRAISKIDSAEWRKIVDEELGIASKKTVKNSWAFIKSVLKENGITVDSNVKVAKQRKKSDAVWLEPDEILKFVAAAKDDPLCVPMLLALMSMRLSEIDALVWDNIDPNADMIRTNGARVRDENGNFVHKEEQKNESSDRMIPLLIPELRAAIKRDRKPGGKVLFVGQTKFRRAIKATCARAGVKTVSVHQLRHSFASLAAHLRIPMEIAMEIGGWSNDKIMREIYTHIARSDIERYKNELWDFYNRKSENGTF